MSEEKMNAEKPQSKAKKIFNIILGIIVFLGLIFFGYDRYFGSNKDSSSFKSNNMPFNKELMNVVNEYNKQAPFMIDANTQFNNMILLPGNEICYNFTAISMTKEEVDVEEFEENLTTTIINQVRTNPDMARFKKNKVTIAFSYKDMNGIFICKVRITPDMYKE